MTAKRWLRTHFASMVSSLHNVQTTILSFEISDVKRFLRRTTKGVQTFMLCALQVKHCDAIR